MPRPCKSDSPKKEVLQIRLTKEEKKMLFETAKEYDFDSVAEMIITFAKIKNSKYLREMLDFKRKVQYPEK